MGNQAHRREGLSFETSRRDLIMAKYNHVAVLMGGFSAEREVSLKSGAACAQALRNLGYQVTEVDVDRTISQTLKELNPDACFNALHGVFGEDGTIQGVLETLQIPYTHSGVMASALAMNKDVAKRVMAAAGVPVAKGVLVNRQDLVNGHPMKPPYVIKPVSEGSSVGIFLVAEGANTPPLEVMSDAAPSGEIVLCEKYVAGRELTCAVMGDVALGVTEIIAHDVFYNYDAKYKKGGSDHICPAEISSNIYQTIQQLALKAHAALGCRGVSRADFRFDDTAYGTNELVCLEVNTQPGMTETSLVPELAAHAGHSFDELVSWIMEDASCHRS